MVHKHLVALLARGGVLVLHAIFFILLHVAYHHRQPHTVSIFLYSTAVHALRATTGLLIISSLSLLLIRLHYMHRYIFLRVEGLLYQYALVLFSYFPTAVVI